MSAAVKFIAHLTLLSINRTNQPAVRGSRDVVGSTNQRRGLGGDVISDGIIDKRNEVSADAAGCNERETENSV